MRAVIQRVSRSQVKVDGAITGEIKRGLLVLLGITHDDTKEKAIWLADKCANLRIFPDQEGKMNLNVVEVGGGILVVSQFTLYGDCSKGKRPGFSAAARPEIAEPLYQEFSKRLRLLGINTQNGIFGADMEVELLNEGPVTLIAEA